MHKFQSHFHLGTPCTFFASHKLTNELYTNAQHSYIMPRGPEAVTLQFKVMAIRTIDYNITSYVMSRTGQLLGPSRGYSHKTPSVRVTNRHYFLWDMKYILYNYCNFEATNCNTRLLLICILRVLLSQSFIFFRFYFLSMYIRFYSCLIM